MDTVARGRRALGWTALCAKSPTTIAGRPPAQRRASRHHFERTPAWPADRHRTACFRQFFGFWFPWPARTAPNVAAVAAATEKGGFCRCDEINRSPPHPDRQGDVRLCAANRLFVTQ